MIYILSTTVIQGIVPNAELAKSTGPFGLAYAQMFNPTVGTIVMALAVMACVGSLLGWQFTLAQTGKAAADERMFPAFFSKVNALGAPITGMVVMGVVQSLMALSTISPDPQRAVRRAGEPGRGHQRDSLHHRAVGACSVMMKAARRSPGDRTGATVVVAVCDALQRLRALRLGQGCGDGRHAGDGDRLRRSGGSSRRASHRSSRLSRRQRGLTVDESTVERRQNMQIARSGSLRGRRVRIAILAIAIVAALVRRSHRRRAATLERVGRRASSRSAIEPTRGRFPIGTSPANRPAIPSPSARRLPSR